MLADARRNALLLAFCQALAMTGTTIMVTTSSLVGYSLLDDKAWATLPQALQVTGTMLTTIPASLLMARIGRRAGFSLGAAIGLVGALVAVAAIFAGRFPLFCLGIFLLGSYNGFAIFYRFAAADAADADFRPKAISWVMAGGVAAAIFGPQTAKWSKNLFEPVLFAGCFAMIAGFCILSLVLLRFLRIPRPPAVRFGEGRRLAAIMRQPTFVTAVLAGMIAYGMMSLVMTATPLAMLGCNLAFEDAAFVIQWHALGMFAPSFVTGSIIRRFGTVRVMLVGAALLAACVAVDLSGIALANFWAGLLLLGVGWNFLFVGATTLLTETYRPEEKAKVQAVNDFLVFGAVSLSSFSSGALLSRFGWTFVNLAVLPPVTIVFLLLGWFLLRRREAAA